MSNPNDSHPVQAKRLGTRVTAIAGIALAAATALLLQLPRGASAGIASSGDDRSLSRLPPTTAAPSQRTPGSYELRCWQNGRLLFEEGPVTLGSDARRGATLVAIDRHGGALIITDTGASTCLARPAGAAPSLALPH